MNVEEIKNLLEEMWKELPRTKQQKWREKIDKYITSYNLTRQISFDVNELELTGMYKSKEDKEEKKKLEFFKLLETSRIKGNT